MAGKSRVEREAGGCHTGFDELRVPIGYKALYPFTSLGKEAKERFAVPQGAARPLNSNHRRSDACTGFQFYRTCVAFL